MRSYLIDTNVIIDAADPDSQWYAWSAAQLISASNDGAVFINPIIYAELAGYADSESQMASILRPICCWSALTFPGRRHSALGELLSPTAVQAGPKPPRCLTFTLAPTPKLPG
jgi:hypothetical protein